MTDRNASGSPASSSHSRLFLDPGLADSRRSKHCPTRKGGRPLVRALSLASVLLGAACSPSRPPLTYAAIPNASKLLRFFEGRTRGEGALRIIFRSPRSFHVESVGILDSSGTLTLTQRIEEGTKPPRTRHGRLREIAPGQLAGSLSDAAGPVTGSAIGNNVSLRYRMAGGLSVNQRLTLAADGRTARNRTTIRRLGFVVATINETISKVD